ncbi:BID domain-containing T4SS effector [Bartonella taylorii]|uniref:BID domain-containing T4SS effector n=1 Tax=Bartonella taylorii TaxID=33046 RepID=UPI001ABB77BB|nr:BID domain-containing T4SS effector [Bartonella taylorii]
MKKHHRHSSVKLDQENFHEAAAAESARASSLSEREKKILLKEESKQAVGLELLSQRGVRTLSEEQVIELVSYNTLVQRYERDVCHWSKLVFGNANALQEKIAEIQKKPILAEDLSWQMAAHPSSVCKLVGFNVCGIKNQTRKQAEKDLAELCGVVKCYGEAVRQAKENLRAFLPEELKRYEKLVGHEKMLHILQSPHQRAETTDMVRQHPVTKRYQARLEHWTTVVFGNSDILKEQTESILQDPSMGAEFLQKLTENCRSFHKLSGTNICGFKNKARRRAEVSIPHLLDSAENFVSSVQQVKESILQSQQEQQMQHASSVQLVECLHKRQYLSKSSECLSVGTRHEVPKTSRQSNERTQSVQPRKASGTKALALAS